MARRVSGVGVDVVDGVLVEGIAVGAVEDVWEAGGIGKAKDAPSMWGSVSAVYVERRRLQGMS